MDKGRIILLVALVLTMLIAAILTWGSIGSILLVFCLLLIGLELLWQWFLYCRDDDYWTDM